MNVSILTNPFQEFLNQNSLIIKWMSIRANQMFLIIKWMSILANPLQEYISKVFNYKMDEH